MHIVGVHKRTSMQYSACMSIVPLAELLPRVGARVRRVREATGLTQAELARRSGVSLRFVADVERGAGNASLLRLGELATALGVSVAELVIDAGPVIDDLARFGRLVPSERRRRLGGERVSIALVGMRGAGKSTVGLQLARHLGVAFVEVDAEIQARAGMPLGTLFSDHGIERYRALEREVIDAVLASESATVFTTGGSVVTDPVTWPELRRRARTAWLRARPESHLRRMEAQGDARPTRGRRDALAELRGLLATREPLYAQADFVVDTDRLDLLESVWALEQWATEDA